MKKRVGLFFMSILVFMALVGVAAVCARLLPYVPGLRDMQIQTIYSAVSIAVFGLWYYFAFIKNSRRKLFARKRKRAGRPVLRVIALIIIPLSMYYICTVIVALLAVASPGWLEYYAGLLESSGISAGGWLAYLETVILAPVSEEIVFRGLIYKYSNKLLPFFAAALWQALLFGLMHGNLIQGVYAFAVGIVLCAVFRIGGSLIYPIITHMIFNSIGMFFAEYLPGNAIVYLVSGAVLAVGIILFYVSFKKR